VKAIVIYKPGAPEELVMAEMPEPRPGAGEVLVDVAFAGCNWADTQIRTGIILIRSHIHLLSGSKFPEQSPS
jgi:NADPH:quinone reductase